MGWCFKVEGKSNLMKLTKLWLVAAVSVIGVSAVNGATAVNLPLYGFQINALDAPAQDAVGSALITLLPVSDGFAPNVNVLIQPYTGAMADYITLSKGQFASIKANVLSEQTPTPTEWVVEYTGTMGGNDLHFYARALSRNGKVYLVTGTAKDMQWSKVGQTLRQTVNSFKLN